MSQKAPMKFKERLLRIHALEANALLFKHPEKGMKLSRMIEMVSRTIMKSSHEQQLQAFDKALALVGEIMNVDRVYLFTLSDDGQTMSNDVEWCRAKIEAAIQLLQELDVKEFSWWMNQLTNDEIIHIEDVNAMDDDQLAEREILQAQSIKSLLVVPLFSQNRLIGYLGLDAVRRKRIWTDDEINAMVILSDIFSAALKHRREETAVRDSIIELKTILSQTVEAFGTMIGISDPYTQNHQIRVSQLSVAIARQLNLSAETIEGLRLAAMMHDIGIIHFPSQIVNKTGPLTDKEYALIKTHPARAYDIVSRVDFKEPIADIILQHHEKLDGSGYPLGLKGDAILIQARILDVADVYEAMVSDRPWRLALPSSQAIDFLQTNAGTLFDPVVVDACVSLIKDKGFVFWEIEE